MQFVRLAEAHGLPRVASIQNEYNLICRLFDTDLAEVAHHEDVGLLAFSPLAAGILTGKYQGDVTPEGSRRSLTPNLGGRWCAQSEAATAAYLDVAAKQWAEPRAHGNRLLPDPAVHDFRDHRRDDYGPVADRHRLQGCETVRCCAG